MGLGTVATLVTAMRNPQLTPILPPVAYAITMVLMVGVCIVASVLAIGLLAGLIQVLMRYMPDLRDPTDAPMLALIFGGVVFLGLVISLLSTWFAVRRYLRMNTDELNWS